MGVELQNHLFKFELRPEVDQPEPSSSLGPFVVAGSDVHSSLELLARNFLTMVRKKAANGVPQGIFANACAWKIEELPGDPAEVERRTEIVRNFDEAACWLSQQSLDLGKRGWAEMIWWPIAEGEPCPY